MTIQYVMMMIRWLPEAIKGHEYCHEIFIPSESGRINMMIRVFFRIYFSTIVLINFKTHLKASGTHRIIIVTLKTHLVGSYRIVKTVILNTKNFRTDLQKFPEKLIEGFWKNSPDDHRIVSYRV